MVHCSLAHVVSSSPNAASTAVLPVSRHAMRASGSISRCTQACIVRSSCRRSAQLLLRQLRCASAANWILHRIVSGESASISASRYPVAGSVHRTLPPANRGASSQSSPFQPGCAAAGVGVCTGTAASRRCGAASSSAAAMLSAVATAAITYVYVSADQSSMLPTVEDAETDFILG